MLELQKLVLNNLSDQNDLFKKELYKSIAWLNQHELTELRKWLRQEYWNTHKDIIKEVFYPNPTAA